MIVRCKSCGHNVRYDIEVGCLYCDFCGSSYQPSEFEDEKQTFDVVSYNCQNCGAKLITTEDTEATAYCSFCGSTSILSEKLNTIKKPDKILPFKITKEQCREIYLKEARKTVFVPNALKSEECVDSFRAIYMPYWFFKAYATGTRRVPARVLSSERDGDYIVEEMEEQTRVYKDSFVGGVAHDASVAFADDISECIGFDDEMEKKAVPFYQGYLSGFYADMADESAEKHKIYAENRVQAGLSGDNIRFMGKIRITDHELLYFPVWFMSMTNGKTLTYAAVNGYTGKIIADFPVSIRKFLLWSGILAFILFALITLGFVLRPEPAFWISMVVMAAGLVGCTLARKRYKIYMEQKGLPGAKVTGAEIFFSIVAVIAAIVMALSKVNWVVYGSTALLAGVLLYQCFKNFRIHQQISQHRPPQFNRKGGDDRA